MATQAQPYVATDEDVPLFITGIPAPQPAVLPLDLVPQQFPKETCTLRNQSARWLWILENRKRKKCAPSSLASFKSRLRKIFTIIHEDTLLADISNLTFRDLVAKASEPYSTNESLPTFGLKKPKADLPATKQLTPTSIQQLMVVLKLVIASAIDCKGNKLFPLEYNSDFIDAPEIGQQHTPCLTPSEIETLITLAKSDQEKLTYQVLCSTGLRIAELQAIRIGAQEEIRSTWDHETASIFVRAVLPGPGDSPVENSSGPANSSPSLQRQRTGSAIRKKAQQNTGQLSVSGCQRQGPASASGNCATEYVQAAVRRSATRGSPLPGHVPQADAPARRNPQT